MNENATASSARPQCSRYLTPFFLLAYFNALHTSSLTLFPPPTPSPTATFHTPHIIPLANTDTANGKKGENPPGNYVSRFIVGNVAFNMGLVQFMLWVPEPSKIVGCSSKVLFPLGTFSTVCLSVVAAICDSTTAQCRGNSVIHSIAAVTFFILYNLNMIVLTKARTKTPRCRVLLPVIFSTLAKARFVWQFVAWRSWLETSADATGVVPGAVQGIFGLTFPGPGNAPIMGVEDQTILAVIEWADVFLIMLWTW